MEATFDEAVTLRGFETGFRECVASVNADFSAPYATLIRQTKKGRNPFDQSSHQFNCKDDDLGDQWRVYPANSQLGSGDAKQDLQFAVFQFPIFNVSFWLEREYFMG